MTVQVNVILSFDDADERNRKVIEANLAGVLEDGALAGFFPGDSIKLVGVGAGTSHEQILAEILIPALKAQGYGLTRTDTLESDPEWVKQAQKLISEWSGLRKVSLALYEARGEEEKKVRGDNPTAHVLSVLPRAVSFREAAVEKVREAEESGGRGGLDDLHEKWMQNHEYANRNRDTPIDSLSDQELVDFMISYAAASASEVHAEELVCLADSPMPEVEQEEEEEQDASRGIGR